MDLGKYLDVKAVELVEKSRLSLPKRRWEAQGKCFITQACIGNLTKPQKYVGYGGANLLGYCNE